MTKFYDEVHKAGAVAHRAADASQRRVGAVGGAGRRRAGLRPARHGRRGDRVPLRELRRRRGGREELRRRRHRDALRPRDARLQLSLAGDESAHRSLGRRPPAAHPLRRRDAAAHPRAASATRLALGIRISGKEFRQGGYDNLEMREMLYYIGETGLLDFVDIDVGHCWGAPSYVPSSYYGHGAVPRVRQGGEGRPREPGEAHRGPLQRPRQRSGASRRSSSRTATAISSAWCARASPIPSSPTRRARAV